MYLKVAGCPFEIHITSRTFGSKIDIFLYFSTMAARTHLRWSCALCKGLYAGDQNYLHDTRMKNLVNK